MTRTPNYNFAKVLVSGIIVVAATLLVNQISAASAASLPGSQGTTKTTTTTTTTGTTTTTKPASTTSTQPTDQPTAGDNGGFVPCGNTADNPCQIGHLFSAFVVIINYLIAMAGFVAVAAIVYAGFMMVYSQGQDQLKEAKGRFTGAIIGLVLVAAAFVIVNSLFSGSLSIGVFDGANILANPLDYINGK